MDAIPMGIVAPLRNIFAILLSFPSIPIRNFQITQIS